MDGRSLLKLVVVAAVAYFGWKWWTNQGAHKTMAKPDSTSPAINCVFEARQANDYFGSRVGGFTNNTTGWDSFKSEVESRISSAESKCSCGDDACTKSREAMNELRAMVNDMDSAVHSNGGVPTDLAQRQERVDQALDAAQSSAR